MQLVKQELSPRALEARAAIRLQSVWRGRRGRQRASTEKLHQKQDELTKLLVELEVHQRHQQLAELQQLESQLAELQQQKPLSLSPVVAEHETVQEGEPPERNVESANMGTDPRLSSDIGRVAASSPRVQLTSPVRTTTWSPSFGRHPSATVYKDEGDVQWSSPLRRGRRQMKHRFHLESD